MGYKVDGIFGDENNPPPPWSDEFDIATLYVNLPRNAGPVSEVAFCHRPSTSYPGYEALVDRLVRAPILRAVVDARAPGAVKDWILEQTTTTVDPTTNDRKKWDYDRIITGHFASPIEATPADVRASFDYLFKEDLSGSSSLPPIACRDWELLDSINQFIAKYNAGEPAVFDFQRGCVAD
jgi:hypothetical protein